MVHLNSDTFLLWSEAVYFTASGSLVCLFFKNDWRPLMLSCKTDFQIQQGFFIININQNSNCCHWGVSFYLGDFSLLSVRLQRNCNTFDFFFFSVWDKKSVCFSACYFFCITTFCRGRRDCLIRAAAKCLSDEPLAATLPVKVRIITDQISVRGGWSRMGDFYFFIYFKYCSTLCEHL